MTIVPRGCAQLREGLRERGAAAPGSESEERKAEVREKQSKLGAEKHITLRTSL